MAIGNDTIRESVRRSYGNKAAETGCCSVNSCCGEPSSDTNAISRQLGYSIEALAQIPEGANMGLGCGNPLAIASLIPGEIVLDLGSGAGIDCFLAARAVGRTGKVIGVDMTPEMLAKARSNASKGNYTNVEFRLGEIESLPVADGTIDVILSNCVINLSPEKQKVFDEAFRALKPGGRLCVSDVVTTADLPEEMLTDLDLYSGCVAGASSISEMESMLTHAGFKDIRVTPKDESKEFIRTWAADSRIEEYLVSAVIQALKPEKLTI